MGWHQLEPGGWLAQPARGEAPPASAAACLALVGAQPVAGAARVAVHGVVQAGLGAVALRRRRGGQDGWHLEEAAGQPASQPTGLRC